MKKILISTISIIMAIFCLFSCSGGDGAPEGLQLAKGGEDIGYYFYVPKEWVVSNFGEVGAAYASKVDASSVSFVEAEAPEMRTDLDLTVGARRAVASKTYFDNSMANLTSGYKTLIDGEAVTFGNAEDAFKFVYDIEVKDAAAEDEEQGKHKFRIMQILVYFEDRFGIFTFSSPNENMSSDDKVQFDFYAEKTQSIIEAFKFVSKKQSEPEIDDREADEDGYLLSSNKNFAKLSLYLPPEYKVNFSSGLVSASAPDGSTMTVSTPTTFNVSVDDYWKYRKSELELLFGTVTLLNPPPKDESSPIGVPVTLEGTNYAFSYEYTYEALGETYHVYQVLAAKGSNGFVFTFTAKEANYQSHIDTLNNILKKVKF